MAWIYHGYNPGRFVTTKIIELPGYDGNAEAASVAYWRSFEKFFAQADEHRGVKVVGLMTHGPGQIHTVDPVNSLADVSGLKLRIGGGVAADVGQALGASGIQVPAPKVYETIASHAADGTMLPFEARKSFKLTEIAKNAYEMPGGFYRGSFAIIMNNDKFNSFPQDIQDALMGVFGEQTSRMAGKVWDAIDEEGRAATSAASDNTVVVASESDQAAYKETTATIIANVIAEVAATGIDAQGAHDFLTSEIKAAN
jgi:TRAP-type C4-dicarboxylate transport system substrate-binding protein